MSVNEYAKENHFSSRHVRWLITEGNLNAQKVGRNWQIFVDQTKKSKVKVFYHPSGEKVLIPPILPDGFFWDMSKMRAVPIEKYAREHGLRLVTKNGRKAIGFP